MRATKSTGSFADFGFRGFEFIGFEFSDTRPPPIAKREPWLPNEKAKDRAAVLAP
jgi:hypothetical protein